MPQSSGPISQGTASERQFTDVQWRDRFGDEPGVLADMDGSSYSVTLPSGSDIVSVGSSTQVSTATVAGFVHRIPASSPEPLTIPAAVGSSRTDIIALRYDPSYTGLPGPVRLYRIAGTSASIPTYDSSPPGVEDLPLWAITRAPGQALSQAVVTRLFARIGPSIQIRQGGDLPPNSPLGTMLIAGGARYVREIVSTGLPGWRQLNGTRTIRRIYGTGARISPGVTFTDSGAITFSDVRVGQQFDIALTQFIRVDGVGVQTARPGIAVGGGEITFHHDVYERIPPPSADNNEMQLHRMYVVTATASTVTLGITLLNGLGGPDLVMYSAALKATLTEAI